METVKATVRDFLRSHISGTGFGDDENIFASGYANSLFVMQLIYMVEREFGIEVADEDLEFENFQSINAVTAFVLSKTAVSVG
jgi:acyl carrier protein